MIARGISAVALVVGIVIAAAGMGAGDNVELAIGGLLVAVGGISLYLSRAEHL